MARARFIALAVLLASLSVVFADCSGAPLVINVVAPYIYYVEIVPNPVNAGDTATFIVSWRDNFRGMRHPTLKAFVYTDAEEILPLPTDNLTVQGGPTAGTVTFSFVAQASYQGTAKFILTDEGNRSSPEYDTEFFVNDVTPQPSPE